MTRRKRKIFGEESRREENEVVEPLPEGNNRPVSSIVSTPETFATSNVSLFSRPLTTPYKSSFTVCEKHTNILKNVSKTTFGLKRTTLILLDSFCRKYINLEIERTPREQYTRKQVTVVAAGFRRSLKTTGITLEELREPFENLYFLIDIMANVETRPAMMLCRLYEELTLVMERLLVYAEMLTRGMRMVTRWSSVIDFIHQKAVELEKKTSRRPRRVRKAAHVPEMDYFVLGRLLGAGGFGVVFKAAFGATEVTLKFVSNEKTPNKSIASMDRMVASMVNHPCIVRYYSCFRTNYANATCMEYICGLDLNRIRETIPQFPEEVSILLTAQLGLAVQHLHLKGFLHRDIKPANLMVTATCQLKLIDFDTAKSCMGKFFSRPLLSFNRRTSVEFGDEQGMGTVAFMAPEILTKKGYGRAVDWWAVGVTAFVFCTGRLPFYRTSNEHITQAIRRADVKWPSNHSAGPALMQLIGQLLTKDLKHRMCCRSYDDFMNHPAFASINWAMLDAGQVNLDYPPFVEAVQGREGVPPSPSAEQKCLERFPDTNFKTIDDQPPLFTYSSPGFLRCLKLIEQGIAPSPEDLFDRYDYIVSNERTCDGYVFRDHCVPIPPKAIDDVEVSRVTEANTTELVVGKCISGYFVVIAPSPDGRLIKGDLILSLNDVETNRLGDIQEFLSLANREEVMRCRLLRVNPFRLLPLMKGRFPDLLSRVDILQATLITKARPARSCQDYGIFISTLEQTGQCIALVEDIIPGAIIDMDGRLRKPFNRSRAVKQERRGRELMMGDVIFAVDNESPTTSDEMEALFRGPHKSVTIMFAPMSSMRCSYVEKLWKSLEIIGFSRELDGSNSVFI